SMAAAHPPTRRDPLQRKQRHVIQATAVAGKRSRHPVIPSPQFTATALLVVALIPVLHKIAELILPGSPWHCHRDFSGASTVCVLPPQERGIWGTYAIQAYPMGRRPPRRCGPR